MKNSITTAMADKTPITNSIFKITKSRRLNDLSQFGTPEALAETERQLTTILSGSNEK